MTTTKMQARHKIKEGQEIYAKQKTSIEPAFGIIKQVTGFRQFQVRGLGNIKIEQDAESLSYYLR